jgi:hypothetical protein
VSDESASIRLNEHQRRHFEVLFSRLEDAVTAIEGWLDSDSPHSGVLKMTVDDLPDGYRAIAAEHLADLRRQIAVLCRVLELKPRRVSRSRMIGATLRAEAVKVEDSLSRHLRGYGDVDSTVAQRLDPALQSIARQLNMLAARLNAPRKPGAP